MRILLEFKKKVAANTGSEIAYISQNPMAVFNEYQNIESHIVELFESKMDVPKEQYLAEFIENMKKPRIEDADNILKNIPFNLVGAVAKNNVWNDIATKS